MQWCGVWGFWVLGFWGLGARASHQKNQLEFFKMGLEETLGCYDLQRESLVLRIRRGLPLFNFHLNGS